MKFSDATLLTFALGAAAQLRAIPADINNINAGPFAKRDITGVADAIDADEAANAFNQVTSGHKLASRMIHHPHYGYGFGGPPRPGYGGFGGLGYGPYGYSPYGRPYRRFRFRRRAYFGPPAPPVSAGFAPGPNSGFGGPGYSGPGYSGPGYSGPGFGGPGFGQPAFKRGLTTGKSMFGLFKNDLKSIETALKVLMPQFSMEDAKQVQAQLDALLKTREDIERELKTEQPNMAEQPNMTEQPNIEAVGKCDVIQRIKEMIDDLRLLLDTIATKTPGMVSAVQTPNNFISALEQKSNLFAASGCIDRDNLDLDNANPL